MTALTTIGRVTTIGWWFLKRRMRDPASVALLVVIPVLVAFIFGYADQRKNSTLAVGVVPGANGAELADAIDASDALRAETYDSVEEMRDAVSRGDIYAGVEIRPDGESVRVHGNPSLSAFVAARADVMLIVGRGDDPVEPELERVVASSNAHASGLGRATAGMLVFFMFNNALHMGSVFVGDRGRGCVTRMTTTPNTRRVIVAGETGGRLVSCVFQALAIVLTGALLFDVQWNNIPGTLAVIGSYALVSTSAALLFGCVMKGTQEDADTRMVPLLAIVGLLGGCFWSLAIVPAWMSTVGHLTPQAWANDGFDQLLATNAGIPQLWLPLFMLTLFAVVLFALAVRSLQFALRR